jgi:hypothetical protein
MLDHGHQLADSEVCDLMLNIPGRCWDTCQLILGLYEDLKWVVPKTFGFNTNMV